ncbi:MAG: phosphatase PAP2 family protein [Vulcanibacillus sp.]
MDVLIKWIVVSDKKAFIFFNHKINNRILDTIMTRLTHFGGATFTISSLLICILLFNNIIRIWSLEALLSLSISHILAQIIKKNYGRPRPYLSITDARTISKPLIDYSFPSGHTTSGFAIATTFALHSNVLALIFLPIAILIGLSRIYLGLHYPTDCIFGALLGTVTSMIVFNIFSYFLI